MPFSVYLRLVSLLLILMPVLASANTLLGNTLDSLREPKTAALDGVSLLSGRLLAEFYAQRDNALVWTDPARIDALLQVVEASPAEGFVPEDFHVATLRLLREPRAFDALSESARIAADIKLSDALLRYVHHTRFGKLDPVAVDRKWNDRAPVPAERLIADMRGALEAADLQAFLASRLSYPFWYEHLRQALNQSAGAARLAGVPPVPPGPALVKGNRGPRVALLRERLHRLGDQSAPLSATPDLFDDALHAEVVAFQHRFKLSPDGVVGPATIAAINTPFDAKKIERIRINLERMRWLYDDLPADYVFVDVAHYMAHVVRDGDIVWSTRVVVGAEDAQTPMFRDNMDHLVFNPTWTVPISIQKKMGKVSASYTLVDRQTGRKFSGGDASNYKRYRVVQQPGPRNALGQVKFMFPNRHSVYLHDTPSKALFGRSTRALSHGCVRVQNPTRLAEMLLNRPDWDQARIATVIQGERTRYVNLDRPLPVLLYYLTAKADEQGAVSFRSDVYGRDQRLQELFAEPVLSARIAFEPPVTAPPPDAEPADGEEADRPLQVNTESQNGVRLTQADD